MSAIPPNNLEQLVAWIRIFAEDLRRRIKKLEDAVFPPDKEKKE